MKPTMLKPHDRLISKLAIIGMFGALLTGCGNQDATSPKSYDIYGPRITLNNPGADAIVRTDSGPKHIPHEDLCYMIDADCIAKTDDSSNIVHYLMLDSHEDIDQLISIKSENYTDIELANDPENSSTDEFIFLPQDVSKKKLLHIDLASIFAEVVVFDSTGNSFTYTYTEAKDIPLTTLEGIDLTVINKIKLVGSSVANTKNLYFHGQKIPQSLNGNITGYYEEHNFGESYTDLGATARDVYDGHVNVETDIDGPMIGPSRSELTLKPLGTELGTYTFTYSAEDSSGNKSKLDRVVEVIDNEAPIVKLTGDAAIVLGFDSVYNEAGASASDIVDGDDIELASITYQKEENGVFINVESISTSVAANYQVIYEFADAAGNTSTSVRSVKIAPPQGETITILKDGVLGADWDSGIQAFDQDLNWGACTVPAGCPNIDWGFVDDDERGSVLEVTHADTSAGAGIFISSSDPIDIRDAEDDGFIKLDLKVVEGDQTIIFKADCGYPCGGGDQYVNISELNKWQTIIVPVKSLIPFGPSGNVLDLEILKAGLVIQALSAKATTFRIDNAYYDCRAATCAGISVPFVPVDWEANHEDPNDTEAFVAPTSYPGYALAWSDEFDGDSINSDNWSFDIGNGDNGWGNGELQYYREDNASVEDGLLIIEAQKHVPPIDLPQKTGNRFTSSKLISIDKVEFKYGRVDIRAVVAEGQGMWSAGWMLGANWSEIGWPYAGEIDIFDTIGGSASKHGSNQEGMIVNNMYWNSTGPDPSEPLRAQGINNNGNAEYRINTSNEGETFSNRFHVFSLIWDEDSIKFEVDGVNTNNDVALVGALAQTYRNPFFLILNVAIGGAWPKSPDGTTDFPDGMLVDYVRVYQRDSDGNGIPDFELDGETPKN